MKKALALISVLALASMAVADYTPVTRENPGTTSGNTTYSGTSTFSGAVTASSSVTTSGVRVDTPTSLNVTNNQAITVAAGTYVLNGIGSPNDNTNTVTVANGTVGTKVTFVVSRTSSNLVNFADSGNLYLSSAALLDNDDTLTLFAASATNWVEIGQTDN